MGSLTTNFQLTLPYFPDEFSESGDNWTALSQWANQYPGIRFWSGEPQTNIDLSTQPPSPVVGQILIQAGSSVTTTDTIGQFVILFPNPFPNAQICTMITNGNNNAAANLTFGVNISPGNNTNTQAFFVATQAETGVPLNTATIR